MTKDTENAALKARVDELERAEKLNVQTCSDLLQQRDSLRDQLEQTQVQLAGCGAVALGYAGDCKPGDYGYSASLGDVLQLRAQLEATEGARKLAFEQGSEFLERATRAEAQLEAATAWRPIETAPKDGTPMWAYDLPNDLHLVVYWTSSLGGFWQGLTDEFKPEHPTHWLPLTPAPKEA